MVRLEHLLFVLAIMGVISQERQTGSLILFMVRPVNALQYIGSKYAAQFYFTRFIGG